MRRRVNNSLKAVAACILLSAAAVTPVVTAPVHAFPFGGGIVLDPSNLAQNILTATRTLQQVNNQIRQLQNEAQMLINDAKNLANTRYNPAGEIRRLLGEIENLMQTAQAIKFTIAETDRVFRENYPEDYSSWSETQMAASAETQWRTSRNAFHDALRIQAQIVQTVGADSTTLNRLLSETVAAEGSLSVAQTGNQLLAMNVKQSMQMQQLFAAQYRAEGLERARRLQIERESRERTSRFVGLSSAYTAP